MSWLSKAVLFCPSEYSPAPTAVSAAIAVRSLVVEPKKIENSYESPLAIVPKLKRKYAPDR